MHSVETPVNSGPFSKTYFPDLLRWIQRHGIDWTREFTARYDPAVGQWRFWQEETDNA